VDRGCHALKLKKNVLHYTFELSELSVGTRYDSNLCGIDSNDVFKHKADVIKFYSENKDKLGRLIIKEYPTSTVTVNTLRAHMERLTLEGFKPDIIIVDYADIMRSSRQFDSLRHELKLIYEELRALASDMKVPVLTASQSNKEGTHADVIDETNMSEGFSKAFVADIILTISRKPLEKSTGKGRLFVAKNRAGKDGLLFPLAINTARSIFTITGDNMVLDEVKKSDENETKAALRKKWEQLQADRAIKLTDVKSSVKNDDSSVETKP
jgi:replicative DNA helicase